MVSRNLLLRLLHAVDLTRLDENDGADAIVALCAAGGPVAPDEASDAVLRHPRLRS